MASSSYVQRYPVGNRSGSRLAFSVFEKDKRVVYVSAPGGTPEKLCERCMRVTDWSRDEKTVLVFGGNPYEINVLDLASHQQTPLVKHPKYPVLYARFSPDNRWISFTARIEPDRGRIFIAPSDGPKPVPESAWIAIADGGPEDWANWSPDGKTLYFTSARDGHNCLWDNGSKQAPTIGWANRSLCSIFTDGCHTGGEAGQQRPGESQWCSLRRRVTFG